jgi:alkylation response protein AidB-like acyl-CoA dehydrogenase
VADRKHRKMDMQFDSCHGTTFLDFEDVRVPKSNLIGQEGWGGQGLGSGSENERCVFCWDHVLQ